MSIVAYCAGGGMVVETGRSDMPLQTVWADGRTVSLAPECLRAPGSSYEGMRLLDAHIELHRRGRNP